MLNGNSDIVAVIPVGPTTGYGRLADTVESIFHYAVLQTKVVLMDNSGCDLARDLAADLGNKVQVIERREPRGKSGKLYINLANTFIEVINTYNCKAILRIDDDGLVIGRGGDTEAVEFFNCNPDVAIIGSYRVTCTGSPRSFDWPARQIKKMVGMRGRVSNGRLSKSMRALLCDAERHSYELGEHCMGGVCLINPIALRKMQHEGKLLLPEFVRSRLEEDHIFGLLAKSSGYKIADFATDRLPVGAAWVGLPCSPEELLARQKKYIHSVRSYGDLDEERIREIFRRHRAIDEHN